MQRKIPKNPYPGLRPFEYAENHLFFGREGQSEELLRRLRESRFLAVVGTSGSGKSSLVRAGLLPLLYGGFMTEAGARWRVALFRPGDNPIHNLADALVHPAQFSSPKATKTENLLEEQDLKLSITETVLRRSAVGLRDYADGSEFAADENLLIVVDQFEELFRFKKENKSQLVTEKSENQEKAENEAAAFVKLLLEAVSDKAQRVYIIITMRSDFLGDCSQFRDLPEAINKGQYLIPRLTSEQLKKAIEAPAKVKGARIQPALVARLLNDIGDDQDQLPVLQHALMRTWDEWAKENDKSIEIGFDHYNATGGMATALSQHADEAFYELGDANSETPTRKQEIAEKLFKCLTETDRENRETRRATTIEKICRVADADKDEIISVIDVFRQPGRTFLMPPQSESLEENTLIDISHESLIRKWLTLKAWVEEEAQAAQTYRRLAEDALLHKLGDRGFWGDPELTKTLIWKENFKPNETWSNLYKEKGERTYRATFDETMRYLNDSRIDRDKKIAREKRQKVILVALTILFFTTTVIAVAAMIRAYQSDERARIMGEIANLSQESLKLSKEKLKLSEEVEFQNAELTRNNRTLKEQQDKLNQQSTKLIESKSELEKALDTQKEATGKAELEQKRADEQTKLARISEEKTKIALADAESTAARESLSREALTLLEQGESNLSLDRFLRLLKSYENEEQATRVAQTDGKWWTLHNLGIVYSRLHIAKNDPNFRNAEKSYLEALDIIGEKSDSVSENTQSQNPENYFIQNIAYQENADLTRNKVTTLRRLAQLYRNEAQNTPDGTESDKFNLSAIERYKRILNILGAENLTEKQSNYSLEVYIELADTLSDLSNASYYDVEPIYLMAKRTYLEKPQNFIKAVAILKKLSGVAVKQRDAEKAVGFLVEAKDIQEKNIDSSPFYYGLADTYDKLFAARELAVSVREELSLNESSQEYILETETYGKMAKLIRSLSFKTNNSSYITEEVGKLAETYLKLGECEKAENTYALALDKVKKQSAQEGNPVPHSNYFNLLSYQGQFYQSRGQLNLAKKSFDQFFEATKNLEPHELGSDENAFVTAADFYAENNIYDRAEAMYEQGGYLDGYLRAYYERGEDSARVRETELRQAKIMIKRARLYEKQFDAAKTGDNRQWCKAEGNEQTAKVADDKQRCKIKAEETYKYALSYVTSESKPDMNSITVSFYLADFYQKTGQTQAAAKIYADAEAAVPGLSPLGRLAAPFSVEKKLAEVNQNNLKTAADHYAKAIRILDFYSNKFEDADVQYLEANYGEYSRYYKNGDLTADFYEDKAKIYEAWASLNGVKDAAMLNREAEITRVLQELNRKSAKQITLCKQDTKELPNK